VYEAFFGLREKPFSLLPDPRFLYAGRSHRTALGLLEYGLGEQVGFVVLTGEVGSGKTTLVRHLLDGAARDLVVGLVTTTHHAFGELMAWILRALDLDGRGLDPVGRHELLVRFLIDRFAERRRVVLIVDEAQNLGEEALEQLRMLSNVNAGADHLLQILLVGQPELRQVLQRPSLRQLVQRIAVDYHLAPLAADDTRRYVRHRLAVAGGSPDLFDDEACRALHWFAQGLPRLVNALADLALLCAFADDRHRVDDDTVIEAALERGRGGLSAFRLPPPEASAAQARSLILGGPRVSIAVS
jgi:general secretion pathway protein A